MGTDFVFEDLLFSFGHRLQLEGLADLETDDGN